MWNGQVRRIRRFNSLMGAERKQLTNRYTIKWIVLLRQIWSLNGEKANSMHLTEEEEEEKV